MMLRRCDRYLLHQTIGPFLLALAGLALFILLNLILRLSELMVDRGIQAAQLVRLLALWMPELIAWAIPMAALFAVFLGLGRMEHDREIMAFESIGVSLRRLLIPLLCGAMILSLLTFAVYNFAMPASKMAAQRTYREILFSQSMPRISINTFFTGARDQYYYVRQYDADDGSVRDVLIYDVTGQLFPQAQSQITLLTAETGRWHDESWTLLSGRAYGFNREGVLGYASTFEELTLPVGSTADQMWMQSKSPSEMGIPELLARIRQARAQGISTNESLVELHQRFALPLSALLFVLVGGTVSLMFGSRNRSTGIIVGLLLIGLYQGTYFWMQAYGRRGALPPALAAWIPNLLFGLLGTWLFIRLDRLASRDMWNRVRNRLPFLTLIAVTVLFGGSVVAQPTSLHLECDTLHVSSDRSKLHAEGEVSVTWEGASLSASSLRMSQTAELSWRLEAQGDVFLQVGEFALWTDRVFATVLATGQTAHTTALEAEGFRGQSAFQNSLQEEHTLFFHGASGRMAFGEAGHVESIDVLHGEVTTCNCCDGVLARQPYTVRASRILIYPDRLIVAFGLTGRLAGLPALWLPVYVQPLEDTLASPLFPAFGKSTLRGWFLKWNLPFYVDESLYGAVLFDYYSRHHELGAGLLVEHATDRQQSSLDLYAFPAVVGDPIYRLSLDHQRSLSEGWTGRVSVDYSRSGDTSSFTYSGRTEGPLGDWSLSAGAVRTWSEQDDRVTQQLPDLSLTGPPLTLSLITLRPTFQVGIVREWTAGQLSSEAPRWMGRIRANTKEFRVFGAELSSSASLTSIYYAGSEHRLRTSLSVDLPVRSDPLFFQYQGTFLSGESPFQFDQVESRSHIAWEVRTTGSLDVALEGGFDLILSQPDPWVIRIRWGDSLSVRATFTYDLLISSPLELSIRSEWEGPRSRAHLTLSYDALHKRWNPIPFTLSTETDLSRLEFSGSIRDGRLQSLTTDFSLSTPSGWGGTATVAYPSSNASPISLEKAGIFKDIAGCLRIGLERNGGATWIYGSILAFPQAVFRYAPQASQVQVGI